MNKEYGTIKSCDEESPILGRGQDWKKKKKRYVPLAVFIALVLGLAFYAGQYRGTAASGFLPNTIDRLVMSPNGTTTSDDPSVKGELNEHPVSTSSDLITSSDESSVQDVICDKDDRDCLNEKIGQGLELVGNIAGGIESMEDALDVFVELLDFMGRLNPAIAAGVQILSLFFGSDSDGDTDLRRIMDRFDILEEKLVDIQKQITNLSPEIRAAFCEKEIQDFTSSINRHEEMYNRIENVTPDKKNKAFENWKKTCNGELGLTSLFFLIGNFIDIMDATPLKKQVGTKFGMNCARDIFDAKAINKSKQYNREFIVPVLSWLTKAMRYLQLCPEVEEDDKNIRQDMISLLINGTFKELLNEAENNWQSEVYDLKGSAAEMLTTLNENYAFGYVYSVVKFKNNGERDKQLAYFGDGMISSANDGVVVYERKLNENNVGKYPSDNIFIFFRKKDYVIDNDRVIHHGKNIVWQNKGQCTKCMCSKMEDNWIMRNKCTVVGQGCSDTTRLINMPRVRSNQNLETLLRRSDGSVMCQLNQWREIYPVSQHRNKKFINDRPDIASSMYYFLERQNHYEGGVYSQFPSHYIDEWEYDLIFPQYRMYMENVARDKSALQSSLYHPEEGYGPNLAIDGWTGAHGKYSSGFTHTLRETNPWWRVNLGTPTLVHTIRIFNREDGGFQSRLEDVIVELIDNNNTTVWKNQYHGYFQKSHVFSVNKEGVVVKVSLMGEHRILSLAEVEVYRGM